VIIIIRKKGGKQMSREELGSVKGDLHQVKDRLYSGSIITAEEARDLADTISRVIGAVELILGEPLRTFAGGAPPPAAATAAAKGTKGFATTTETDKANMPPGGVTGGEEDPAKRNPGS
jgi:hypothetical protein